MKCKDCFSMYSIVATVLIYLVTNSFCQGHIEPAIRVVRFGIDYPNADIAQIETLSNWQNIMRKSVLASLRFVNKHWLICGEAEREVGENNVTNLIKSYRNANDCGKLQVTGETIGINHYRVNATFVSNKDPIKNAKVEATSTVFGVVQIGLRGGIFQYTNGMKLLGKPLPELYFEEAYFCYPGYQLTDTDKCHKQVFRKHRRSIIPIIKVPKGR